MVETRNQSKVREREEKCTSGNMSEPVASTSAPAPILSNNSNVSVSSRSSCSSGTIRAQRLTLQAAHLRKVAEAERSAATAAAAAAVAEAERKAADLELEAQLATLEAESGRSRRSSRSSIQNWLASVDTNHNQNITLDPISHDSNAFNECFDELGCRQNNKCGKGNLSRSHLPFATATIPVSNPNQLNSNELKRQPTDISLLAQAITSLAHGAKPKFGDGRLPLFDGKALDWLAFKRVYEDTSAAYSPSENLARIGLSLRGAAREAVSVLLVSARDPVEVMEALSMRFGRSELIVLQEITAVRLLPKLGSDSFDLNKFACKVRNCVEILKLLDQRSYLESPEIFQIILSKLNILLRSRWTDFATTYFLPQGETKLELLARFLAREVEMQLKFGLVSDPSSHTKRYERVNKVSCPNSTHSDHTILINKTDISSTQNNSKPCLLCKQSHNLSKCETFLSMSVSDRWQFVKENKLCNKCLKKGSHSYKYCKSSKEICNITDCKFRHHKLLHNAASLVAHMISDNELNHDNIPKDTQQDENVLLDKQPNELIAHLTSSKLCHSRHPNYRPLLKVIAVTISGPLGSVDTYALLDDGSTATFIDSELCDQIGVTGPESHVVRLDCVGGLRKEVKTQYVDFNIKGRYCSDVFTIHKARSVNDLGLSKQTIFPENVNQFPHLLDLVDVLCYENAEPKVIIGIDNWHLTISKLTRKGNRSQPVAIKTNLGWVLFGFQSSKTKVVDIVNHVRVSNDTDDLNLLVQDYFKLDSLGISKKECLTANDTKAIKILDETTRRLDDGTFEVGLPWSSDNIGLPDSFAVAMSRFKSLENKMSREPTFAKQYKVNMHAFFDKKYAEGPVNFDCNNSRCWYLPHFGVTNPNKPGKLRIVHDAAAKSKGVSLNSLLLTGPDLLNSILDILYRFREGKIGLSADIREMFPQVKIREADRDAQRFIWRDSPDEPFKIYRMSSMIFGAASSPFTAQYIKNKNAVEFQNKFPRAVDAILNDHYMDDCIVSTSSVEEAMHLASDILHIHKNANFEMRAWVSNDPKALSLIPKDLLLDPSLANVNIDLGNTVNSVRTLGLVWRPVEDCLIFNVQSFLIKTVSNHLTKREALSLMMCIYDPLGLLSPLIVRARIMFQNVWRKAVEWDHQLSQEDTTAWREWHTICVDSISKIKIPRRYNLTEFDFPERELHLFCDASESAYAAVAYWRLNFPDGTIRVVLITSKVRVAPLKPVSIPRLELQGALVAARLADTICNAHRLKPNKRVFWCDSMNVLGWLRNDARNFKPFVANRVGEILELTNVAEWRWVPSEFNVADDATRLSKESLTMKSRWFTGPNYLFSSDHWPVEPVSNVSGVCQSELKSKHRTICHAIIDEPVQTLAPVSASPFRVSRWLCLIRATALAHLFARKLLNIFRRVGNIQLSSSDLTAQNLYTAECHILWQSQIDSFKEEIACLKGNTPLPHNSRLKNLSPKLSEDNLLRLTGRIAAAEVNPPIKFPIILDGKHPAVRLLVLRYHQKAAHANTETVVNELRQVYWIINLRSTVRSVANNCLFCKQRKAAPYNPPIGQLPHSRLAYNEGPFSYTGLDYFGPVQVTVGRRHEKRYVALYTCLVTRAVHLEVVHSLSSDSAMMSLRRFIARRGYPRQIYSDNGTAFVGLNRELKKLYGENISDFATNEMIEWKFIPPAAPFMGGAWERLVRSIKTAFKVTLKERSPSDEVLSTLLLEAEAIVNSRPLTHVPSDPDCPEALTPFHFLIGSSSGRNVPYPLGANNLYGRISWKKSAQMADQFWQRWLVEYLPLLNPSRTRGVQPDVKVGDVVMIVDGNLPRCVWPKGRIINLYRGKDGVPRVADVATSAGQLKRPLRKLVPLNL